MKNLKKKKSIIEIIIRAYEKDILCIERLPYMLWYYR